MNANVQSTDEVLTEIAQEIEENGSYELTVYDEVWEVLGISNPNDRVYPRGGGAVEIANGTVNHTVYRLFRIPSGEFVYVRETWKVEDGPLYDIKGIGDLDVTPHGVSRSRLESEFEELAIEVTDEVYEAIDEFVCETEQILSRQVESAAVFDGSGMFFEMLVDKYAGWGQVREEVMEYCDEDELPAGQTLDDEWGIALERVFGAINTPQSTQKYDTDLTPEYAVSVEFDHSNIIKQ